MASVPAEADALSRLEEWDIGADGIDYAGDFVAGRARKLDAGPLAFFGERVTVADAAGVDANADVSRDRAPGIPLLRVETHRRRRVPAWNGL